jgi:predicted phosphodiesterase
MVKRLFVAPKARGLHTRTALALGSGPLRIAAVADTHGRPHPALGDRLREIAPHHILHAGDIGDLSVLRALERHAPVTAVRGNIDERAADLPDVVTIEVVGSAPQAPERLRLESLRGAPRSSIELRLESLRGAPRSSIAIHEGDATLLNLLLLHIAVNGPKLRADVARMAKAEDASLVVCGHSHVPFAAHDKGVTVFNPGSVGPKRFDLPIVLGVIDITRTGATVRHVNCETGLRWP